MVTPNASPRAKPVVKQYAITNGDDRQLCVLFNASCTNGPTVATDMVFQIGDRFPGGGHGLDRTRWNGYQDDPFTPSVPATAPGHEPSDQTIPAPNLSADMSSSNRGMRLGGGIAVTWQLPVVPPSPHASPGTVGLGRGLHPAP